MENRDFLIEGGLSAIEKKLAELKKPDENYKFKTNCKFGELNIKVLPLRHLIGCLADLYTKEKALDAAYEALSSVLDKEDIKHEIYGFNMKDWDSDIRYLIEKVKYNDKKNELQKKADALKKYYSDDRQADLAVQDILNTL